MTYCSMLSDAAEPGEQTVEASAASVSTVRAKDVAQPSQSGEYVNINERLNSN